MQTLKLYGHRNPWAGWVPSGSLCGRHTWLAEATLRDRGYPGWRVVPCSDAIAVPSAVELAVVMASMIDGTTDMAINVIAIATHQAR